MQLKVCFLARQKTRTNNIVFLDDAWQLQFFVMIIERLKCLGTQRLQGKTKNSQYLKALNQVFLQNVKNPFREAHLDAKIY